MENNEPFDEENKFYEEGYPLDPSSDDYDEGYKDDYEAGLEARPSDDSAFNGYYGADGGFHEYNNGWEGE